MCVLCARHIAHARVRLRYGRAYACAHGEVAAQTAQTAQAACLLALQAVWVPFFLNITTHKLHKIHSRRVSRLSTAAATRQHHKHTSFPHLMPRVQKRLKRGAKLLHALTKPKLLRHFRARRALCTAGKKNNLRLFCCAVFQLFNMAAFYVAGMPCRHIL